MDIRVLGPLEVERDGELLGLGGKKQRSVLAVLVLHAREVVGIDRLADAIWDGEPPASIKTTLRSYVSNLRKALEPDRSAEPRILRTTQSGYLLEVTDEDVDARRFERLVADGRDRRAGGDLHGAVESWTQALALWRGDAFQDFAYDGFAQTEIGRLHDARLGCTEDLFEARIELGHHDAVAGDLEAFCASHPGRERALRLRMLALYRCGRQTEALEAYEQGRRRLAEELGVDPSRELRELHEQIVRQDERVSAVADAPSGKQTLTFLLGDVERSTEKLRALGDDYAGVLEEHRRLLKQAFAEHGGRGARTWGDGVFAAFDGATDAVAAAVATQLALNHADFGEERTLAVRMGLHTGEATFSDAEYVGLAVHLASRVMDAAHGGQILVSQATKDLVEAEEGRDAGFVDTGNHTLKDFPDAVRLFQVTHPELRRDFPPLRTRAGRTDNLPDRLTSFVGRERELVEIADALSTGRVVTLTGVGGVGKTRLATEAAKRLVTRYPDGVWLCELAPIGDAEAMISHLATTLGLRQQPERPMRETVLAAMAQRASLLLFDNCEHLLDAVAELVEDILSAGGGTDVLATSREALGVEGERARPVLSLRAEAVKLFEDRARAVRPDFRVDERNAADVADICSKLDGIPLAIELAAAVVTSLSPAQIATRLEEGFHFLRSGRRAAVDRHRTLHGAIEWSYAMLTEAERVLFDRLSVFAGGFTLEAAEAICGPGLALDVADGLASLVAKSLVDADVSGEEARYLLLETMRQYGQDRLAERGEADVTLRAHALYFASWVEVGFNEFGPSVRQLEAPRVVRELDNFRAAFAWARAAGELDVAMRLAIGTYFPLQDKEAIGWSSVVADLPGAPDHPLYPLLLGVLADGLALAGDRRRAEEIAERALEATEGPEDPRRIAAIAARGTVAVFEGRLQDSTRYFEEALALARSSGNLLRELQALSLLALAYAYGGEYASAIALAEEALDLVGSSGGATLVEQIPLYALGEVLAAEGSDPERALDCLDRSIALSKAAGLPFQTGIAAVTAASLRTRRGDVTEALRMFREAVNIWRLSGVRTQLWTTLRNLVELFCRIGCDEAAVVLSSAADASSTASPSFGAEAERLEHCTGQLAERMDADVHAAASERGRKMSDEDVIAFTLSEIDRALEHVRVEAGT